MRPEMPRILFAAAKSGSGKTTITCGMLEIMKRRGKKPVSFKCGPDYIDPMFHRQVLGIPSGNLDTYFTGEEITRYLLAKKAKQGDITVLEGVMGYYDGLGGQSVRGSTYEVARVTGTPAILVIDGRGASVSLAALIQGMIGYRRDSQIEGVILNRVSPGYYDRIKSVIEQEAGVKVLGYVPELSRLALPSRYLGLVAPEELEGFSQWVKELADTLEETLEIDGILETAKKAPYLEEADGEKKKPWLPRLSSPVQLAVAKDEAFSFYYEENLELLQQMGARIVFFSPRKDKKLPKDIDGLLLGGGYPERYGKELSENRQMKAAVKEACRQGMPCLAECGGFLYLAEGLEDEAGTVHAMTGVLKGEGYRTKKLSRFGYLEVESQKAGVLGEKGTRLKGHEFHYWDCTENGRAFLAKKPFSGTEYSCMQYSPTLAAGFPHFYYYSNPMAVYSFLKSCQGFQAGRLAKGRWDSIAKPIDSLGLLESQVVRLCKIRGRTTLESLRKRALLILCSDHGVVKEGVTQTGKEVTQIVSENFAKGVSTVNYMAKRAGVDVYTIDIGMDTKTYPEKELVMGAVIDRKIRRGSGNIAREPAMARAECRQALETGRELVRAAAQMGYGILATGEMGIGNTTPASALTAAFLGLTAREVTGKGAGLSEEGFEKKCQVVENILKRVSRISDPVELLTQAGGLELAGMAGIFLGGAAFRIPIVIDGAISAAAALAAARIDERVKDIVLASHMPKERAGGLVLEELGAVPLVYGNLCLGEGTGAVTLFPLLDMAIEVYEKMGSFQEYEIEPYERFEKGGV